MIIFLCIYFLATGVHSQIFAPEGLKSQNVTGNFPWTVCKGGWISFNCENLDNNSLPLNRSEFREYRFRVKVVDLQEEDHGIKCFQRQMIKIVDCEPQVNHTAYNKAETTIICDKPKHANDKIHLCKDTGEFNCSKIRVFNKQKPWSPEKNELSVNFTDVTSENKGIYWCVTTLHNSYTRSYRKIHLTVRSDFDDHREFPVIGQLFEHSCKYSKELVKKFFCKGKDPLLCKHLVTSEEHNPRINLNTDIEYKTISITMRNVTDDDNGIYWFGAENATEKIKEIYCRLDLTVVPRQSLNASIIIPLSVCVAVLLLVVAFMFIRHGKRRDEDPPQRHNTKEEYIYEEIPTSATARAVTTVYATAGDCEDSLNYVTIDFGKSSPSSKPKPSTSHCEYSTVFKRREDECSINKAPSESPLYANVKSQK